MVHLNEHGCPYMGEKPDVQISADSLLAHDVRYSGADKGLLLGSTEEMLHACDRAKVHNT
jgi:hypothetical protein